MGGKDCCYGMCSLILHLENFIDLSIVALGPTMRAGLGIDELQAHPDTVTAATNAALQDIVNPKGASHLPDVNQFAFVLEARISSNDEQLGKPRQIGDDILCDAVSEIFKLWIVPQIG